MLWFKVAIGLLIVTSAAYYWAKYNGYWPSRSVQALKWREFGGWELYSADGKRHVMQLLDNSYTSAFVTILNFKTLQGRRFSVILTPDLLPIKQARHLKRRLLLLH